VSHNKIGDAGLAALAPALVHVRTLHLSQCGLTSLSGGPLASLIRNGRALESLHVDNNSLRARGIAELAAALQPSSSLRTLHAERCNAGADGTAALAAALDRGWRASELDLSFNHSLDGGALALAAALERLGDRCTLTALSLPFCLMTAVGALALVRAATRTPRLQSLDLNHNGDITIADRPAVIAACGPQPHFELQLAVHE
jgi:Ran GTPase-activating protein (RanGAP) involved in mRNA processing and transport